MRLMLLLAAFGLLLGSAQADDVRFDSAPGDALLAQYFQLETAKITDACLADVKTLADWEAKREIYRSQLQEMLGLNPWPERTPLNAQVTRTIEHADFVVEMLHYESSPGLYVTANLYRPKVIEGKLPAVLYVCGHSLIKENGISYGNKVGYHHHGCWFAQNGYICLTIDTIQLGEIEGLHHGTYREGMWWWASRGYTPAGVEAWNGIRGLDYLASRPDVDATKMGVTGRSGGGAYSWWIAALDERVQCAVPVAGITSMQNHIVDGCIEGHCDCMFMVNTYQWDFPLVAALIAPRPLLISNTDKDTIFPLDGVVAVHRRMRPIYDLYHVPEKLGLHITEGPHKDTQELRSHAFVWFNRFLKGSEADITIPAVKMFQPPDLKVFDELPRDERVTNVHEWFVPEADATQFPATAAEFTTKSEQWLTHLRTQCLRAWPPADLPLDLTKTFEAEHQGVVIRVYEFTSQAPYRLPLIVTGPKQALEAGPREIGVNVVDSNMWQIWGTALKLTFPDAPIAVAGLGEAEMQQAKFFSTRFLDTPQDFPNRVVVTVPVRGVGPTAWTRDDRERTHIERRFLLLGQSRTAMQAWDIQRALQVVREVLPQQQPQLEVDAFPGLELPCLIAGLTGDVQVLRVGNLPTSFVETPALLNAQKSFDIPQLMLLANARMQRLTVNSHDPANAATWKQVRAAGAALGYDPKEFLILEE